jgi:hypothetical protein
VHGGKPRAAEEISTLYYGAGRHYDVLGIINSTGQEARPKTRQTELQEPLKSVCLKEIKQKAGEVGADAVIIRESHQDWQGGETVELLAEVIKFRD